MQQNRVLFLATSILLAIIFIVMAFISLSSNHARIKSNNTTIQGFSIIIDNLKGDVLEFYNTTTNCKPSCNSIPFNEIVTLIVKNKNGIEKNYSNPNFLNDKYLISTFKEKSNKFYSINFIHEQNNFIAYFESHNLPASISDSIYSNDKLVLGTSISHGFRLFNIPNSSLFVPLAIRSFYEYYVLLSIFILILLNTFMYYSARKKNLLLTTQITDQTMSLTEANKELEAERDIFAEGPVLIIKWTSGRQWSVSYVSPNCQSIIGYSYGDFMGDLHYDQLIHPEDLQRVRADIDDAIIKNNSTIDHREFRISTANDGYIWVDSNTKIFLSNDGEHQMLSYLVDVNDKMDAFRGLRNQRLAMDQATVLSSTNLDGVITYVNDRFCDLSGQPRENLIGGKYSALRSDMHNKLFFTNLWETVSSGKIWAGEICNTNSKGQLYWTQTTIIPSLTEAGNIFEYQSIAFEITSTKNAEKQLMLQRTIAEKATEAKTHFLANMSHELRTPMNGLMGMASLLETTELTPQQQKFVAGILSSADHQLSILNNILDLSKMQSGHMALESIEFDLSDLLLNIVTLFTPNATDKNISMGLIIHNNLSNIFMGDKSRIKQLITNFVSNSVKFTDKGKVVVVLSDSKLYDGVRIDVEDTGLGISPDSQSKLFKKFTQVDETITRRFGGTGLGLSICKYISKGLGGNISVTSTENVGSIFSLDMPLLKSDAVTIWPSIDSDIDILLVGKDKNELSIYEDILTDESVDFKSVTTFNNYSKKKLSSYDVIIIVNGDDDDICSNMSAISGDQELALRCIFVISIKANPLLFDDNNIRFLSKPITSINLLTCINDSLLNKTLDTITVDKPKQVFKIKPGLKFLIVDDNASNREILDLIIISFSGKSDLAIDGAEAITMIEKNSYDLIFMDCHMPNMDGYQTIEVIRKMGIHTPIIMVTADIDKDVSEKATSSGANDLILKPISISEIKNVILKYCVTGIQALPIAETNIIPTNSVNLDSLNMMMDLDRETCKSIISQIVSDYDMFKNNSIQFLDTKDYDSLLSGIHKFKGGALSFAAKSTINSFSKLDDYLRHEKNINHVKLKSLITQSMQLSDQYIKYLASL